MAGWNSTVSMAPLMASGMTSIAIEAAASPLISPASALLVMEGAAWAAAAAAGVGDASGQLRLHRGGRAGDRQRRLDLLDQEHIESNSFLGW